ncbi:carboxylesterase-like protein [Xylariaceae sp. FL0594]|nr:carboxylesterase-like protein [Xylariaceae sp. FL0594]
MDPSHPTSQTNDVAKAATDKTKFRVFVFSKTAGYRHASIPAGIRGLEQLGASSGLFTVEASEDASLINYAHLSQFKVVIFLSTSGEFLNAEQIAGLRTYMSKGGAFVGIHCASAGMYTEPWYGEELVGAYFADHPAPQDGVFRVDKESKGHVIVSGYSDTGLPEFKWFDEWYNFKSNPRGKDGLTVLLSTDKSLFEGGTTGDDHPLAWCRELGEGGGRSFYTALGHFDEAYSDEGFMRHVLNGILWTARLA